MTFSYRNGVALLQLLVFVPAAPLAGYLCFKHGFNRASGWRFLLLFILIRIIGAIAELISINNPTQGAYTTIIVCNSLGLSPLVLLCTGLLSRLNDQIQSKASPKLFKLMATVSIVGLILAIVGGSQATNSDANSYGTNTLTQVAVILFAVVWVFSLLLFAFLMQRYREIPHVERRLLVVTGVSVPLVLVRLIYSILHTFTHDSFWNNAFGNVTVYLCMAVVEEIVIVLVSVGVGVTLPKISMPASGKFQEVENPFNTGPERQTGPTYDNRIGNAQETQYHSFYVRQ